jgi:hypothetical protein
MSLSDMQIPKKDMTVRNTADLEGTQWTDCQKTSTNSQNQHQTAEAKTSPMQRH